MRLPVIKNKTDGVHSAPAQIFSSLLSSIIPSRFFAAMAIFAGLFSFGITSLEAANFNSGNLAVIVAASNTNNNTTASVIELSPSTASQANPVQTITIDGNSYRVSGSASSTLYLANSADGSLIALTAQKGASTTSASNANTLTSRGVVTIDNAANVNNPASWTGTSGQQTRCASSLNNSTWFIGDQNGFYTGGATTASPTGNVRGVKAFGSAVYAMTSSATAPFVGIISAATGGTYTALTGLPNGATSGQDFYLIQSGSNGTTYDVLYILSYTSATVGTVAKYSLVSGTWTANGTYTTGFGGFGLAAKKSGSGADLFVTSGSGATAANILYKLTDTAGHNATIAITTANNVSLYTAASGTTMKGVAFAPVAGAATITGATTATAFTTTYGTASAAQTFAISGSNLAANLVATAPTGFEVSADGTSYSGTATFSQSSGAASGSLRVRLKANAAVSGSYNAQNIVLSSTGATSVNIVTAATGNTVTAKGLTITAIDQTVPVGSALDNTTGSTLFTPSGLANSETVGSVSLNFGGNGAVAGMFAGAIVPSAATGGSFTASNYSISYANGTLTVSSAPVPTIAYGGETLPALSTTYPLASSSTSFTISGVNMEAGIMATAPTGFEVSADDIFFAASVTAGASGSIGTTTVYVRLSGSTSAGSKSGSVALTSSSATTINVPLASSTVLAKPLTGSFTAANKTYDATTSAAVSDRSLTGVVEGDDVTLTGGVATFDTAGAGTGKTVALTGAALSGIASSNYTIASVSTTTADITQADQTITFAALSTVSVSSAPFSLSGTASSLLVVTYASSDSAVATVSGNTVTIVGPGTCNITASQEGDGNYKAATDVVRSLVVNEPSSVGFNGNTYTQNFESMTSSTTVANVTVSTMTEVSSLTGGGSVNGWYIYGSGWSGSLSKWQGADTGSSSTGGFRQLIDTASTVGRALGSQGSGTTAGFFGVVLKNTSGRTIDKVDISYDAVMNRNPASNVNNYPMSYLVSSAAIAGTAGSAGVGTFNNGAGTWVDGVGFSTPTTGTGAPGTQTAITPLFRIGGASITQKLAGLNWPANGYLYLRWKETDETGSDADAGIDNFTISAVSPAPTISSISPTSVLRGSENTPVTFTGTGYAAPETTVSISGSSLSLTNVSSNSLTANVTSNYFTTAGTLTMTLSNPTPGGGSVSTNLAVVTPLPTILGFSPASVVEGAGDTLVTVSGTGFFGDSVIRWNGTDLVTSYNSPNQLTTTIPAVSLSSTVVASVTVATPDVGDMFKESLVSIFQVTGPTVPQVTPSVGTLSGFDAPVGTPSAEQSYTLQGQYLSSNVVLTASDQFQISKTSGSEFGSSLDLTAGEVEAGVIIYVRYNPSAVSASHIGNISHVSDGAVTQNVEVTGNSQPTLTVDPTSVTILNGYGYVAGGQSGLNGDTPGFIVSGARLAEPVTVTAPANYGVSNDDGVTFARSVTLNPNGAGLVLSTLKIQFQPLGAVTADESVVVTAGLLTASLSANGRASALEENDLLTDQAGDQRVKLSWASRGGTQVIVLASIGSSISDVPSNVGSLTANAIYGEGSKVGSSYVVYKENQVPREQFASEKVTITGLANGQQYTFKVFVVSGDAVSAGTSAKSIPFGILSNVLTQWRFNSNPADADTSTGTLLPSTGVGTASAIGLSTTAAYVSGSTTDLLGSAGGDNSALVYTGPTSGSVANKSAGVQIAVSTVGKKDIVIYWDNRASNAGPKHLRAQYTLDVTVVAPVWVDYVATTDGVNVANGGLYEAQAGDTWYILRKADLTGVTGVADNAKFGFRLVASYAPNESGYRRADGNGTLTSALAYFSGNFRTDMLTVTGASMQAQTPFETWASGYSLSGANAAGTADPDYDGMDNNTEFAFGTSPVSGASRAVTQESVVGGIKIKWLQRSGVTYTVKSTDNLGSAFSVPISSSPVSPQPGGLGDYQQYEATLTGGDRGFIQVEATVP